MLGGFYIKYIPNGGVVVVTGEWYIGVVSKHFHGGNKQVYTLILLRTLEVYTLNILRT